MLFNAFICILNYASIVAVALPLQALLACSYVVRVIHLFFQSLFKLSIEKICALTINYPVFCISGLKLVRPSVDVARYKMNQNNHFRSDGWSQANRVLIYNRRTRQDKDGLNSITKLNFTLRTMDTLLFTLISINLQRT